MVIDSHLVEKAIWAVLVKKIELIAPLFVVFAYVSYRLFNRADSDFKPAKFVLRLLGITILVLILIALFSVFTIGLNGYALLAFGLSMVLLAPGLIYGLIVGSAVGISVRGWKSGQQRRRTAITLGWSIAILAGIIYGALWLQTVTYVEKLQVKEGLARNFVKHNQAVIYRVGANVYPLLAFRIFPKGTNPRTGRPQPIGYVFGISNEHLYAVVSTPPKWDDAKFSLDCITHLTNKKLYGTGDRCNKVRRRLPKQAR